MWWWTWVRLWAKFLRLFGKALLAVQTVQAMNGEVVHLFLRSAQVAVECIWAIVSKCVAVCHLNWFHEEVLEAFLLL